MFAVNLGHWNDAAGRAACNGDVRMGSMHCFKPCRSIKRRNIFIIVTIRNNSSVKLAFQPCIVIFIHICMTNAGLCDGVTYLIIEDSWA